MAEYHQTFASPFGMAAAVDLARQACEAEMGGHPMVCVGTRQGHSIAEDGTDIYEVWASFVPYVAPPAPTGATVV